MEMVEAIIDNNYDVNLQSSRIESSDRARDDKSNFETTTSLRAPLKAQLSRMENNERLGDKNWQQKVQRQGTTMMMMMVAQT